VNAIADKDSPCSLTHTAGLKEKLYRLNDFNGPGPEVKHNGKSSKFALDEYPAVKLAEAREKCE